MPPHSPINLLSGTAEHMTSFDNKKTDKPAYAPIPARAVSDTRLSALDFRVLAVIAVHDRLGANGIGCYASHSRLAGLVDCHLKSLSRSIRDLAGYGYISASLHPLNKRLRVYSVIYTPEDQQISGAKNQATGNETVTSSSAKLPAMGNETATEEPRKGNKLVPDLDPIGNQDFGEVEQIQEDADVNIFCEAENTSCETVRRYSAEAASPYPRKQVSLGALTPGDAHAEANPGGALAILERALKSGSPVDFNAWQEWLEVLTGEIGDIHDPVYGRACRLSEELPGYRQAG